MRVVNEQQIWNYIPTLSIRDQSQNYSASKNIVFLKFPFKWV